MVKNDNKRYLLEVLAFNPSRNDGKSDPLEFENWVNDTDKLFDAVGCPEELKVGIAAYILIGQVDLWWGMIKNNLDPDFEWEGFKELFQEKFYPTSLQQQKEEEFLSLKLGRMSIIEYAAKFNQLSRFAPYLVNDETRRMRPFKQGLSWRYMETLSVMMFNSFQEMYEKALKESKLLGKKKELASTAGRSPRLRRRLPSTTVDRRRPPLANAQRLGPTSSAFVGRRRPPWQTPVVHRRKKFDGEPNAPNSRHQRQSTTTPQSPTKVGHRRPKTRTPARNRRGADRRRQKPSAQHWQKVAGRSLAPPPVTPATIVGHRWLKFFVSPTGRGRFTTFGSRAESTTPADRWREAERPSVAVVDDIPPSRAEVLAPRSTTTVGRRRKKPGAHR
ncbi:hypothetical protein Droror1_Dr00021994 [Drosera rotundifolia]